MRKKVTKERVKYEPYKHNPRILKDKRRESLRDTMERLGDISGITFNETTSQFITGNQRSTTMNIDECDIFITDKLKEPDDQGTVAWGYVIWEGRRFNYRRVRWDLETEKEANIVANKAGGEWDYSVLKEHFDAEKLIEWGFEKSEITWSKEQGDKNPGYTKKVGSPLYEPKEEKPTFQDLYDDDLYQLMIKEIKASKLSREAKKFLSLAASRHIVFNYEKIADMYAYSDAEAQDLFEKSALVIIDFARAIELGFVRLTEELRQQYIQDDEGQ